MERKFNSFKYNWKLRQLIDNNSRWFTIIDINENTISLIYDYLKGLPEEYIKINRTTGKNRKITIR